MERPALPAGVATTITKKENVKMTEYVIVFTSPDGKKSIETITNREHAFEYYLFHVKHTPYKVQIYIKNGNLTTII